jgi:hypothetical protein
MNQNVKHRPGDDGRQLYGLIVDDSEPMRQIVSIYLAMQIFVRAW